jgi:hypothetical protein
MALYFRNQVLPGNHSSIVRGSPNRQIRRFNFWRIDGEGEIVGELLGRELTVELVLANQYTRFADLRRQLDRLDSQRGLNGTLRNSSGSGAALQEDTFNNVTFDGYEMASFGGQQSPGPLQDVANTLFNDSGTADGGWFVPLILRFYQLLT